MNGLGAQNILTDRGLNSLLASSGLNGQSESLSGDRTFETALNAQALAALVVLGIFGIGYVLAKKGII